MLYRSILRPLLFRLPPETAHELALHSLSSLLSSSWARDFVERQFPFEPLPATERFGLSFPNPIGIAAGFDKNGIAADALSALGFGFVEVGTVTHLAQPGNPKPRLFRLPEDRALVNRQGFNNHGAAALAERLCKRRPACVLGVNIGKSRAVELEDATADYLASFELIHPFADYIAINVSSPNTPNLRELQRADALAALLKSLQIRNLELASAQQTKPKPLLVKIAPDLERGDLEDIADVAQSANLAGIIATNTTTSRAGLSTSASDVAAFGNGGLSGAPLRGRSTQVIADLFRLTKGKLPIIGVGGIFTADDAWEKIRAGASLLQLYTGFVYQGWGVARDINQGLKKIMEKEGVRHLDQAVGTSS